MNRRMVFPLVLGLAGCVVLIALGVWQVQRLHWKQDILAQIGARIEADPVPLPVDVTEAADEYRNVFAHGVLEAPALHVLISHKPDGPGFRVVRTLQIGSQRRVLVDTGFVPEAAKETPLPPVDVIVSGALLWPDENDSFTPAPNLEKNIWFARDLPAMAAALHAAPVLIVASYTEPATGPQLLPVTIDIPNDHFGYAVTWFSLAAVWALMTVYALSRIKRRID